MTPTRPPADPNAVPDPVDPDATMPIGSADAVAHVTHEVDADDMFDPMAE